ncbi:MAG: DUF3344 domain-containing protein [Methanoregula sp.]|nr:DUF3344 domain-containing protein [Methanoregula sp.]
MREKSGILIMVMIALTLLSVGHAAALYDFEGIPLHVVASGAVQGDVITAGRYGLDLPPYELRFTLPASPSYAQVYTGIWGGTEKYTGRADLTINNIRKVTYSLNGEQDRTKNIYESGHGVYWISYDATQYLKKGSNSILINTSRSDPDNRLDGRVYGVFVVAVTEDPTRPFTQYWIAEGNENLHGEGWAGTNPTRNDQTSVLFTNNLVKNPTGANLTVLLIAGNQGQPDFLFFNDQQMGTGPAAPGHASLLVTDIANEQSFDAASGSGKQTRYADAEIFTVSQFMATENNVTFIRGIDINGDGTIDTSGSQPEGEDYIHPCSAILAVSSHDTPLTDISVENIQVVNAYENEVATISADLHSYGIIPKTPVPVVFQADGVTINSTTILIPANGILTVTVPWTARAGTVELSANADVKDDARVANNRAAKTLTIGSPADLSLSIDAPYPADKAQTTPAQKSPILPALAVLGILFAGILVARRGKGPALPALLFGVMLVISCAGIPAVDAAPATGTKEYTLPVHIQNGGGSDSPAFLVCVYLDGERVAEKTVTGGIPAHGSTTLLMPLFTTPGSHGISVTVDEAGTIRDSNKANNSIRGTYVFS